MKLNFQTSTVNIKREQVFFAT